VAIWNRDARKRTVILSALSRESQEALKKIKALEKLRELVSLSAVERLKALEVLDKPERLAMEERIAALEKLREKTSLNAAERFKPGEEPDEPNLLAAPEAPSEPEEGYGIQKVDQRRDEFFHHNHHLELRFPKGILSKKTCAWIKRDLDRLLAQDLSPDQDAWYIHYQDHPELNTKSIYLLSHSQRMPLEAGDGASETPALEIVLPHIAAKVEVEAQMLPVEIRPGPLTRRSVDPAILGPRIRTVEVLSERGRKTIPLHFDVVGSNTVLNDDESETALLLRITNVDREEPIPLDRTGHLQTRFILACEITDHMGHQEWALTDESEKVKVWVHSATGAGVVAPNPDVEEDWKSGPLMASTNGRMVEWVIEGEQLGTDMLKPNDSVYLRLKVKTGLRSGPTDVHLYYRHVPGYWDGSRACTIQKSPLLLYNPSARASIQKMDSQMDPLEPGDVLVIECSTTPGGTRELRNFAQKLNSHVKVAYLYFDNIDQFRQIAESHDMEQKLSFSSFHYIDQIGKGPLQESKFTSTDESRSRDLEQLVPQLTALLGFSPRRASSEHVGIGTNQPASKLVVTDGLTIGADWAYQYQAPKDGLLVEGNVGVGAIIPETKLHVHGGRLRVSATTESAIIELKNKKHTNYLLTDSATGHLHLRTDSDEYHVVMQTGGIQGNVGIGIDVPGSSLSVSGGVTIGRTYATKTADTDNLVVEGKIGIGTDLLASPLTIQSSQATALTIHSPDTGGYGINHLRGTTSLRSWVGSAQAKIEASDKLVLATHGIARATIGREGKIDIHHNRITNYKGFPTADIIWEWSNIPCNEILTYTHDWYQLPSLVQVWVKSDGTINSGGVFDGSPDDKDTKGNIYDDVKEWKMAGVLALWEGSASYGVVIEKIGTTQILLRTGNSGLFHGTRSGNYFASGKVRLMMWK